MSVEIQIIPEPEAWLKHRKYIDKNQVPRP